MRNVKLPNRYKMGKTKRYKFTCYPSVEEFSGECEGETIEEAIEDAQCTSDMNYGFIVLEKDLKEVEEV